MKNSVLAIGLTGCIALLYFWFFVPLPLATGHPADQLLNSSLALSDSAHSLPGSPAITYTYYLPILAHQHRELHGYVTENGQPAQGITVTLYKQFPHPYYYIWLGATTTDSNGYYNFTGTPSLSCDPNNGPFYCWGYYIDYFGPDVPSSRLEFWETAPITDYVQGTARQFPTFDISAPVLLFPNEGDVVSPTVIFTWVSRPFPEDNYGVVIGPDADVRFDNLGYTNAYTATLMGDVCNGPCSRFYDTPLHWRVWIRTGENYPGAYGYTQPTGVFTITAQ
jgi:hypothetical protein